MRGLEDKEHERRFLPFLEIHTYAYVFAVSRNTCPKFENYMDPHGEKEVQSDFLMIKN